MCYLLLKFSCIKEIENLKKNEGVENESEMARVDMSFIEHLRIVIFSIYMLESSTSDSSSWAHHSIFVFPV